MVLPLAVALTFCMSADSFQSPREKLTESQQILRRLKLNSPSMSGIEPDPSLSINWPRFGGVFLLSYL
jgi:hypothetical protein